MLLDAAGNLGVHIYESLFVQLAFVDDDVASITTLVAHLCLASLQSLSPRLLSSKPLAISLSKVTSTYIFEDLLLTLRLVRGILVRVNIVIIGGTSDSQYV
jgi:hypothetical protein